MLNQIQLIGYLGKDPELRYTASGKAVARFSLAVSRTWSTDGERKQETTWFACVAWEHTADFAIKYLAKGKKVFVQGRMVSRDWTDANGARKTTWEVVVSQIELLWPKAATDNDADANLVVLEDSAKSLVLADDEFV